MDRLGAPFFVLSLLALLDASTAHAQACTEARADRRYCGTDLEDGLGGPADYGPRGQCLGPNDDGSSRAIDITSAFPMGLNFFGTVYTSVYLNTNGNITFRGPLGTYTPNAFPIADQPMIAPYWADVDIRGSACTGFCSDCLASCANPMDNGVWYHLSPGRAVFTWDNTGYFSCNDERQMSFQLILSQVAGCGSGPGMMGGTDFQVEFRFNRCQWDTGEASSGTAGFATPVTPRVTCSTDAECTGFRQRCDVDFATGERVCHQGVPGQSGFDAGNRMDFVEIRGSRTNDIARRLCEDSNLTPEQRGVWRFFVRGGVVMCPDAGEECTIEGAQGVCALGRTSCVGGGTVCAPSLSASAEVCDNLDNDCDGMVDEGEMLCTAPQVCASGRCVDRCFEGGCGAEQTCTTAGICVETACLDVTCPAGQRCEGGSCVAGCDGVSCPLGQTCIAGRCVDGCATIMCDAECQVCDAGECVTRCEDSGCPMGETCNADGVCRASACGAGCPAGQVCGATGCVDACEGVRCPAGETCESGSCVATPPPVMPDAGTVMGSDAGSVEPGMDGGTSPGEVDAGRARTPGASSGCACTVTSRPRGELGVLATLLLLTVIASRRRRAR